jgi:hypothetical protein
MRQAGIEPTSPAGMSLMGSGNTNHYTTGARNINYLYQRLI